MGWREGWRCVSPEVCVSLRVHVSLWFAHHRLHEALAKDEALTALQKVLYLLDGILDGQVGAPCRGWGVGLCGWGQGPGPMTGGLSRGGLGGAEPCGRECYLVPRTFPRTVPRDRVMGTLSVPSTKCSMA